MARDRVSQSGTPAPRKVETETERKAEWLIYITDLHLGHANVIRYDSRPFADLDEMYQAILDRWNATVKADDTVFILGDFCWAKESE